MVFFSLYIHAGLTSDKLECPLNWIRRVDFGACYFFSNESRSWDDAQVLIETLMF